MTSSLSALERKLGVNFNNLSLLEQAVTHSSFLNENEDAIGDNERLEYLGDAVIDFVVADWLFQNFPDLHEGRLTRVRAALVQAKTLAMFARTFTLGEYLRMGRGESDQASRNRDRILCSTLEAVLGALYLDQGLAAVKATLIPLIEPQAHAIVSDESDIDSKSQLQEWVQAELNTTPEYITVGESGPDHDKQFIVEARINGTVHGTGRGSSKRKAAQAAAKEAYHALASV